MSMPKRPAGRTRTAVTWVLRILLAAAFLGTGGMKLGGMPAMIELFDTIGIGQWFRYVTGGLEVLGALGLLVPRLVGPAALGLAGVMIGAIFTDLFVVEGSPAAPVALLVLTGVLAWLRFSETAGLLRAVTGRAPASTTARST